MEIVQCTIHGNTFDSDISECAACAREDTDRLREENAAMRIVLLQILASDPLREKRRTQIEQTLGVNGGAA